MTERRRISYSQYSTWSACPQHWKLKYVDKIRPFDQSMDTIFGTSIHEAVQDWLKWRANENGTYSLELLKEFKQRLIENFRKNAQYDDADEAKKRPIFICDRPTFEAYYREGVNILVNLVDNADKYFPPRYVLLGIEIELAMPLSEHLAFTGFIDIVLHDEENDQIVIIDLKTAKAGWGYFQKGDTKKLNQILLYKKFYSDQFNVPMKNIRVEFIILTRQPKKGAEILESFIPANGKLAVLTAEKNFMHFINTTFAKDGTVKLGNLPPSPSKSNCKFCPFKQQKDICPVGVDE